MSTINRSFNVRFPLARVTGVALSVLFASTAPVWAQDVVAPEVENSRYSFSGVINSSAVFVRSGAGENFYPTMKLDKGAAVTVVGIRFDWLKITPPDGSFAYVAKAFVEQRGDGSVGRLSKGDVRVRAGSNLNDMKTIVLTTLDEGTDVTILGEKDEYYKIVPPPGTFYYVNKQFVDPVKPLAELAPGTGGAGAAPVYTEITPPVENRSPVATTETPGATGANGSTSANGATGATGAMTGTEPPATGTAGASTAQPTDTTASAAATQPSADLLFEQAELALKDADTKPLEEQPVDELLKQYTELAKTNQLPESLRRIVDFRIATLTSRSQAKVQVLSVRETQRAMGQKRQALKAEHEELLERIKASDVQVYTAVGTLQTSSLQQGGMTLYRLTDPANGRTVVYLRSNDERMPRMIGQFIGVKGEVVTDQQLSLRVITSTDMQTVDPNKLFTSVAATIVPPSLLSKAAGQ